MFVMCAISFALCYSNDDSFLVILQHVFADTLRSSTILVAGSVSFLFKAVPSDIADAWAAIGVSFIICISAIPLTQGIVGTAFEIRRLRTEFQEKCV